MRSAASLAGKLNAPLKSFPTKSKNEKNVGLTALPKEPEGPLLNSPAKPSQVKLLPYFSE
jgi:hypothetical protein